MKYRSFFFAISIISIAFNNLCMGIAHYESSDESEIDCSTPENSPRARERKRHEHLWNRIIGSLEKLEQETRTGYFSDDNALKLLTLAKIINNELANNEFIIKFNIQTESTKKIGLQLSTLSKHIARNCSKAYQTHYIDQTHYLYMVDDLTESDGFFETVALWCSDLEVFCNIKHVHFGHNDSIRYHQDCFLLCNGYISRYKNLDNDQNAVCPSLAIVGASVAALGCLIALTRHASSALMNYLQNQ